MLRDYIKKFEWLFSTQCLVNFLLNFDLSPICFRNTPYNKKSTCVLILADSSQYVSLLVGHRMSRHKGLLGKHSMALNCRSVVTTEPTCWKYRHVKYKIMTFTVFRKIILKHKHNISLEPRHEKTEFLPMRKQRLRSASQ